jgi:hypothetical protein
MTTDELNPLTLGDTPEEYIENSDGSVTIPDLEAVEPADTGFLDNLAETLDKEVLDDIATELVELIEKDKVSREKRDKQYQEGLRRTGLGDDAPGGAEFEGSSRVVHPVLAEACVDFASRAIKELFPASGPVKPWVIGNTNPAKLEKANRKTRFMNWQLTTQIKEYRDELEQILTQVPMGGSQFQKFWYDDRLRRTRVEFVPVDEILLPYSASSFYTAQRATHRQEISKHTFKQRVKSGLYRDVFVTDLSSTPEGTLAGAANDKIEGREDDGYNEDGLRAILEIYTWRELDDDEHSGGEYAPYIITIDEDTEEVLAVYRNWDEQDPTFEKLDWFVEWKFIPWRGAYAIGLPHLIGGLSAALTGSLRALLDSAHINNAATMLKLKSGRISGQNTTVNVTQVCEIEGPAGIDDVRKLAMPMPFNPPSPVLAGLMDSLYALAKGVVSTAEDKIQNIGDRTPVGTTQAIIEQGSNTYSAIHARLHESQKKALAILHRINSKFLSDQNIDEEFMEEMISEDDFAGTMDVIPVSDPTIFSETQRFAQSQAVLQMAQQDAGNPAIPWDQVAVRRRILKQMRIDGVEELLPPDKEDITADALTENTKLLQGHKLKVGEGQNHLEQIMAHTAFLMSPLQLGNPLIPPQALMALIGHIGEHIQQLQTQTLFQLAQQGGGTDHATAQAQQVVDQQLMQTLQPIIQSITQAQQQLQAKMPKPQLPPEVQASIQIAQMDIERKKAYDQATLQNKQTEQSAKQQLDAAQFQAKQAQQQFEQGMEAAAQRFEQFMETQAQMAKSREDDLNRQIELIRNEQDNKQHQMTELLKNHEDNQTQIFIEQMKAQLAPVQEQLTQLQSSPQGGPDLNPQLQQVQFMLGELGKQQTNEALGEVMKGLQATIQTLNKPKMLIRDASGKAQGIQ